MRAGNSRALQRRAAAWLVIALVAAAGGCRDGTGPSTQRVTLQVFVGEHLYGLPSGVLADLFEVLVLDEATGRPVDRLEVEWEITAGSGGVLLPLAAETDEFGVARVRLRLGPNVGTIVVEADARGRVGARPRFTGHAIPAPQVATVTPADAAAGATVVLQGTNFHPDASSNVVRFGGLRGTVLDGSTTQLRVRVPACVASRSTAVTVQVGAVQSNALPFATRGSDPEPLQLAVGAAHTFAGAELGCMVLPGYPDAEYVLVLQNAFERPAPGAPFELLTFVGEPMATAFPALPAPALPADHASAWELGLRQRERGFGRVEPAAAEPATAAAALRLPAIGERRSFNVLTPELGFKKVDAEVKHVSSRAILYQDLNAPSGGLGAADFAMFAAVFDEPIQPTLTAVFGQPSDIDGNERIIILFTPEVNALTRAGDAGFIAGYFYGCDLVERQRCSGTNRAEIFYSMVPDPNGQFSQHRHRVVDVLQTVPAVLAHEFQHMIHFAQKGALDELWLSEGLAHAAEDVVADVFAARGDAVRAQAFSESNYRRARSFLQSAGRHGILAEKAPGTLEMRGGAWLLMKYLAGHHGGNALLGTLTRSTSDGIANVVARVGRPWPDLLGDFAVALHADGLVEPLQAYHAFTNFSPRDAIRTPGTGAYPLSVNVLAWQGAARTERLPAGSAEYNVVRAPGTGSTPVHVVMTGRYAGAFAATFAPRLTVLRTR